MDNIIEGMDNILWQHDAPTITTTTTTVDGGLEARVTVPTAFVFGSRSPYFYPSMVDTIPSFFANASVEVVEDAGHFVYHDQKLDVVAHMQCFLDKLSFPR